MKTRSIGVLGSASFAAVASVMVASGANADFIGFTSTTRAVTGGFLVNVFAVTDNSTDVLLNVLGGTPGQAGAGFITTNSAGGFQQSATNPLFAPGSNQSWTTLDSFMTVGGTTAVVGGNTIWRANFASVGDPNWNDQGNNAFNTPSDEGIWENPYVNVFPAAPGAFLTGTSSAAIALSSLGSARNGFTSLGGVNYGASSAAAAAGTHGYMVAQMYVAELGGFGTNAKFIDWRLAVTIRRTNSTTQFAFFNMRVGDVPAPGALALLGLAGVASRRRRA